MGCCTSLMKYFLFALNVLFWLAGAAILGIGIWLKVDPDVNNVFTVAGVSIYAGAVTFIVLGCVMFVIGFCGCCGAIKENKCLLGTYFALVLVIFIAQLTVAIWAFVSHASIEDTLRNGLNTTLPINPNDTNDADAVRSIQSAFKCCGLVNGCADWAGRNASGCSCTVVNSDCIVPNQDGCTNADSSESNSPIYSEDCFDAIVKFIEDNIIIIAGVGLGIALAEIFLMISTIIVCNSAGKSGYETA